MAQQPLVVSRLDDELRFPKVNAVLRQIGVESYCMLPLTTAVRRLGAMAFGRTAVYSFTQVGISVKLGVPALRHMHG